MMDFYPYEDGSTELTLRLPDIIRLMCGKRPIGGAALDVVFLWPWQARRRVITTEGT